MSNNRVKIGVDVEVDKKSISVLRQALEEIKNLSYTEIGAINNSSLAEAQQQFRGILNTVNNIENALDKSFNKKLGSHNLETLNRELKKSEGSLKNVRESLSGAGAAGTNAFRSLANQLTTTNKELKQSSKLLDDMATTIANTVKWNIASTAINTVTGSVEQAIGYIKSLDNSLNDIVIVTGKSGDEMDRFAKKANDAAKALGVATVEYTDSALTFYQQGLSDEEVEARTSLTMKVANASGLGAEESAEYVTAVLNGYKIAASESEAAMDILAKVGAETAVGLDDLAEGMSKVASAANTMGVSEQQLAAILATTGSVTRQEAGSIGNAYKTILARISDIEAGSDEAEVSLGDYTQRMKELGFSVLDSNGKLRNQGEVLEEIGSSWETLSREQQISLAQTMAGTR